MAKKKCDYCGEYYDEAYEGTLHNGSPACPHCVDYEDAGEFEKIEKDKTNEGDKK